MTEQTKTKEELTIDLQELQQKYDSLKITTEKDIRERKKAEESLRKSRDSIENLMNSLLDIIISVKMPERIIEWSNNGIRSIGYEPDEIIGQTTAFIFTNDENYLDFANRLYNSLDKGYEVFNTKEIFKSKNGETFPADVRVTFDMEDGEVVRATSIIRDITERKKNEDALLISEERFRALYNNNPIMIFTIDTEGIILSVNDTGIAHLEYSREELLGNSVLLLFHNNDKQKVIDLKEKCLLNPDEIVSWELRKISKNGKLIYVNENARVFQANDGSKFILVMCEDITERKLAEEALKESEEKFKSLMEQSPFVVEIYDLDGLQIAVNKAYEGLWGFPAKTTLNKFNILKSKENIDTGMIEYTKRAYNGESVDLPEYQFDSTGATEAQGKGRKRWLSTRLYPLKDDLGNVNNIVAVHQDITDRKNAETALVESEKLLKQTQQLTKMGGWKWNVKDQTMFWTEETYRIHEIDPNEIKEGSSEHVQISQQCYEEKDRETIFNAFLKCINDGSAYHYEFPFTTVKGNKIWIRTIARAEKENSIVVGVIGNIMDITERKKAEQELLNAKEKAEVSEERWGNLFKNSPNAIAVYKAVDDGNDFVFTDYNLKAQEIDKISRDQVLDKRISEAFPAAIEFGFLDVFKRVWKTGLTEHKDVTFYKDDRLTGWRENIIYKLNTGEIVAIYDDVTELKKAEAALITAKEKAEESDLLKSAFLANMSHEIRTPMNGILGFADLLKEPELSGEQQQKYIGIIEKSGSRMLNIINDIVDISKIEAGLMKLNINKSNINKQIEYIYTFFKPEIEAKGLKFSYKNTLTSKEAIIKTDSEKIYAILSNLVKNAIKFTPEGSIEFGYNLEVTEHVPSLQFYVKDTGIGIPADRQEAIFERFIQADIDDKMARQGAGLGLAITKAYTEMLGGKIWVESVDGKGSIFYFTVPYNTLIKDENTSENAGTTGVETPKLNLEILIVEDDEISGMLVEIMVNMFSKQIIKANSGVEAIEACRNNPDIDLILMDIQMPGISGYEVTRQIRQFNKNVVIIAQTAFGLSGDREKALEAGCNDYISKPIKKAELIALIQKYF